MPLNVHTLLSDGKLPEFNSKVHPSAIIDSDVEIGAGTYVAAGSIISTVGGKITMKAGHYSLEDAP